MRVAPHIQSPPKPNSALDIDAAAANNATGTKQQTLPNMKVAPGFRLIAFLALGLVTVSPGADAQSFSFSAAASANTIGTNGSLTYTISLTNGTGLLAFVTNALSGPVQLVSASPASGVYLTNSTTAIFDIDPTVFGSFVQLTVTVQSTTAGFITNAISVIVPQVSLNVLATNMITQVTNAPLAQADLAVSMTGPAQAVITNDFVAYGVTVSNLGPSDASGVFLTNTLPPGVRFISVLPSSQTYTTSGSNVLFGLGTLSAGAFENFSLRVQPTNAGTWSFSATINSANITDPNPANNTASINFDVGGYLSTNLVISILTTQRLDMLDGLMEQWLVLSNAGPASVDSARVVVSGLTNQLYNAVGTNNGKPFVVYGAPLDTNQTVQLLMQYYVPTHRSVTASLQAYGVPAFNLAPPTVGASVSNLSLQLPSGTSLPGSVILSFPSISNRTYTVVYSDNLALSNGVAAQPVVPAYANRTLWIDYGPPTTVSPPTNTLMRFYRVILNP
jgi:uncharacterized repeat protein (TIGR01451 family)